MRVIAKSRLVKFWKSRKKDSEIAERDFTAWYNVVVEADWPNHGAMKQTFGTADRVGDCVVFDVGNNRFRLICRVRYNTHIVYVLKAMDHDEYSKQQWIETCGCHKPPPKRSTTTKKGSPRKAPGSRGKKGRR